MTSIWIDIEDASGNKYGMGPIFTESGWTSTRRLDAAGTFSFTMPASDPMAAEVQNKRYARCWRAGDDITNVLAARARLGTGTLHLVNGSQNHMQLSDAANSNRWSLNIDGSGNLRVLRAAGSGTGKAARPA